MCPKVNFENIDAHQTPHVDTNSNHWVMIYYVNDSDGDTFLFDNNDVSIEPTKPIVISNVINALRKSRDLPPYGSMYSTILTDVITNKKSLKTSIMDAANQLDPSGSFARQIEQSPTKPASQNPMTACYIDSSFPALLYFAYKYADDPKAGLLASANAGGENVNRSAVLGALLGAQLSSKDGWGEELVGGLHDEAGLRREIERFTDVFF